MFTTYLLHVIYRGVVSVLRSSEKEMMEKARKNF